MTESAPRRAGLARLMPYAAAFVAGSVVMFAILALWNGDLPVPRPTPTPTPTVTPYPLPDDAWATTTATAMPAAVTPPGSILTLGVPGQVEIALGDGRLALLSMTPSAPIRAPDADLAILRKAVPQLNGMAVYYFTVSVTKVAGDAAAGANLATVFDAITSQGQVTQRLSLSEWRRCSQQPLPVEIDETGGIASLCFATAVAEDGLIPAGVVFSQSGGPYDLANKTQVQWLP